MSAPKRYPFGVGLKRNQWKTHQFHCPPILTHSQMGIYGKGSSEHDFLSATGIRAFFAHVSCENTMLISFCRPLNKQTVGWGFEVILFCLMNLPLGWHTLNVWFHVCLQVRFRNSCPSKLWPGLRAESTWICFWPVHLRLVDHAWICSDL